MNTVLITGATSGIGRQLAEDYAKQGIYVIACGRNTDVLDELADKYASIEALAFDLTDLEQSKQALSGLGNVPDLWIFNAGDCEYVDNGQIDAALFKRVMDINVLGLTNAISACQDQFKKGHRLAIVGSIASVSGYSEATHRLISARQATLAKPSILSA